MNEREETLMIKRHLRRTWPPFFSRFGRLLPVQRISIPRILSGANLVIASPTASGKTEAVVAPLAERLIAVGSTGLKLIYISPTRALVNDLDVRLTEPLSEVGLFVRVKTGDRPQFDPVRPADVLLTTPEATDSLLCRYPSVFESLRAVVLDELHLVDGMYRGDQMRLLLNRMRSLSSQEILCHALSATLADPIGMASRYFANPDPVVVHGQREIEHTIVGTMAEATHYSKRAGMRKVLVFANSRRRVEELAAEARGLLPSRFVAVHHGSLARREREDTEEFMRTTRIGLCVATMTLEIGIDIGDIDAVILAEPPTSVSALLQRVGRGNRRSNVARAIAICSTQDERKLMDAMFEAARQGDLESHPYQPDLSVVVQQLFSVLFSRRGGVPREEFPTVFRGFCEDSVLDDIMVHLAQQGLLEEHHGRWYASSEVMDMGDRGSIHSNIPNRIAQKVIDATSEQEIGEGVDVVDQVFALAGRAWRVVERRKDAVIVQSAKGDALPPVFRPHHQKGAFHRYLPSHLQ